jgi:hypothetical protein
VNLIASLDKKWGLLILISSREADYFPELGDTLASYFKAMAAKFE